MGIERSEGEKEDKTERKENIKGDWALNDILEMENLLTRFYSITYSHIQMALSTMEPSINGLFVINYTLS